eukprot:s1976_g15.t1
MFAALPPPGPFPEIGAASTVAIGKADPLACRIFLQYCLRKSPVALNSREPLANCIGLLPGILPDACVHSWTFCADPDLANSPGAAGAETLALEALEALVESCPKEEVPILLESLELKPNFRDTFGKLLRGGQAALTEKEGLGATLCWASVTAALLRRDNAQQQAAAFLEALLSALDQEAPVGPFVPMAFRVLAPVKVESAKASRAKLPPLALQQLSRTVLPSLIARTKGVKAVQTAAWAKRAALESAVALLAGLSPEVLGWMPDAIGPWGQDVG